jgi:N-acyl-D-amino-acid deacylase
MASASKSTSTTPLDLLITNGTVVDGTGGPSFAGNVGVRDGKVAYIGSDKPAAKKTIDASEQVVAPGFVDVHTHFDAQVVWDPMLSISPWHGVTTVVMGNCGFGIAPTRPQDRELIVQTLERVEGMDAAALREGLASWGFESFGEYLDVVTKKGVSINVAAMLGHTPVRTYVMGKDATERAATPQEVEQMRAIVSKALDDGAIGFSTSRVENHVGYQGKPVPSRAASLEEIDVLVGELRGKGMLQVTTGPDFFFKEWAGLARKHDITICWTGILADRPRYGITPAQQMQASRAMVDEGLRIYPQICTRPLSFELTMDKPFIFEQLPEFRAIATASNEERSRVYRSPEFREKVRNTMDDPIEFLAGVPETLISYCESAPELEEQRIKDAARDRGVHPADLMLDLALENGLRTRYRVPVSNRDEPLINDFLHEPCAVLGFSDAGAHSSQLCDACWPTYFLDKWVRGKNAVSLEEAVRMMSSWPAEIFNIQGRGMLKEGMAADIVIFDPKTVAAQPLERVRDFPAGAERLISRATGISHVIVNGEVIRKDGRDAIEPGARMPGHVLRNGRAAAAARG